MLNRKMIKEALSASMETKEVFVEVLQSKAFVKQFSRKDSAIFLDGEDTVSAMVFAGVVDDKGERVFESVAEVGELSNAIVIELFKHVNDYNSETVESQAKK